MSEVCKKHRGDGWYDSTKDCYICELKAEVAALKAEHSELLQGWRTPDTDLYKAEAENAAWREAYEAAAIPNLPTLTDEAGLEWVRVPRWFIDKLAALLEGNDV